MGSSEKQERDLDKTAACEKAFSSLASSLYQGWLNFTPNAVVDLPANAFTTDGVQTIAKFGIPYRECAGTNYALDRLSGAGACLPGEIPRLRGTLLRTYFSE
ncbi:MAG: hypothetical protein IT292_09600 [Deltaproteobacteria bacterium]|nr:hypothetical protein [Deltaproteobacteria bacterium]